MSVKLNPTQADYRRRGTVFVHDYFSGRADRPGHGENVARSAQDYGFKGPVVGENDTTPNKFNKELVDPSIGAEEFRTTFRGEIEGSRIETLDSATKTMRTLEKQGVTHSALNLSQGASKASTVQTYYESMRLAWEPHNDHGDYSKTYQNERGKKLLHNFAKAYDLDEKKLLSSDPKVFGPERARLQKILVGEVQNTVNGSDRIRSAQSSYDATVTSFEKNHNSVVVAGENDGQLPSLMKKDLGGKAQRPTINRDFFDNPLANSETTVVGAVNRKGTAKAKYSTNSKLPEVYADGSVAMGNGVFEQGTSFAAPRTAAAIAKLHKMNPHLSSQQVEDLLVESYTSSVGRGRKQMQVLDIAKLQSTYGN